MGRPLHGHENKSILDAILSAPFVGTTLAALNTWLSANLDEVGDSRPPTSHGSDHTDGTDNVPDLVGDSGSGGTHGLAPAPAAGDAAAGKYLKANATWDTPASGSVTLNEPYDGLFDDSGTLSLLARVGDLVWEWLGSADPDFGGHDYVGQAPSLVGNGVTGVLGGCPAAGLETTSTPNNVVAVFNSESTANRYPKSYRWLVASFGSPDVGDNTLSFGLMRPTGSYRVMTGATAPTKSIGAWRDSTVHDDFIRFGYHDWSGNTDTHKSNAPVVDGYRYLVLMDCRDLDNQIPFFIAWFDSNGDLVDTDTHTFDTSLEASNWPSSGSNAFTIAPSLGCRTDGAATRRIYWNRVKTIFGVDSN